MKQANKNVIVSAGALFSSPGMPAKLLIQWNLTARRQALEQFCWFSQNAYLTLKISNPWLDYISDLNLLPTLQMIDELNIDRSRIIIEITEAKCEQISPNFNLTNGQWLTEYTQFGFNWSWRPYFYELLALEYTSEKYRLVTSESYRDFNTKQLCKILSIRLDQERILLVDRATEWSEGEHE